MKTHLRSLKIRRSGSKPNHKGSYSKGYKIYKERNHGHQLYKDQNTKGETVTLCKIPRCKYKKVER